VGGNLLDVEDTEAMGGEDAARGREREVREVLVVDRVELVLFHEAREVRELHRDDAVGLQQLLDPGHEVVEVGHLGQHVVPDHEIGADAVTHELVRELDGEELGEGLDPALDRVLGDVLGGLDPQHRYTELGEVLQEIAVVARELHDQRLLVETEAGGDHLDVRLRVREPGVGVGGEVGVVPEDVFRAHVLLELYEEALPADVGVQRIEGLAGVEILRCHIALAQRREAEVDEGVLEWCAAEAARRPVGLQVVGGHVARCSWFSGRARWGHPSWLSVSITSAHRRSGTMAERSRWWRVTAGTA
jgi:hypothetical protein